MPPDSGKLGKNTDSLWFVVGMRDINWCYYDQRKKDMGTMEAKDQIPTAYDGIRLPD